jgi:hypothetical protein
MTICNAVLLCAVPVAALAQPVEPLNVMAKLNFHVQTVGSPLALLGTAAYAGALQESNTPREWGQGAGAYGERFASALGSNAIHGALAFGLDSALHQDPRYFRSRDTGFWRRAGHALHGTVMTRTDSGGETLSTWRLGSAYGAAFLSNEWYPERLNTVGLGVQQGSIRVAFDFVSNLAMEFWPDVRRKILRRKP